MARRSSPPAPLRPVHTAAEKRRDILLLRRRLQELEALDPNSVTARFAADPKVNSLQTAIESTLASDFGEGTTDYDRYSSAAHLDNGPIFMDSGLGGYHRDDVADARRYIAEGKDTGIAVLNEAIRFLEEELEFEQVPEKGAIADELARPVAAPIRKVFVVHGHDEGAREIVARFLQTLGFEPIILHEQASRGRTVIEKIEAHGDVGFAVILLTPDDKGCAAGEEQLEPRARQNVLLELGYFMGRLGRDRVCALRRGNVAIPSDFAGVVWESMDDGGWKLNLGKELAAAGFDVDWNKVMK